MLLVPNLVCGELEGDGNDGHKGGSLEVPFDFGRYLEEKD